MASARQIAANRKKGKIRSKFDGLKHGLSSAFKNYIATSIARFTASTTGCRRPGRSGIASGSGKPPLSQPLQLRPCRTVRKWDSVRLGIWPQQVRPRLSPLTLRPS